MSSAGAASTREVAAHRTSPLTVDCESSLLTREPSDVTPDKGWARSVAALGAQLKRDRNEQGQAHLHVALAPVPDLADEQTPSAVWTTP
jgi:hypothetical protein